ncbi:MAG: MoxR family ATPase, partial [Methanosphaera sp.]|nr:MoxR family ATPase [Methanosphaera sp.]
INNVVEKTQKIRKLDLTKKPSIRATVDWVMSLIALGEIPPTREAMENTLNVIAKNEDDKERIINEVLNKL